LADVVVAAPDGDAALDEEPDELPHAAMANAATTAGTHQRPNRLRFAG
jgi:hypothetical protein